VRQPREVLDGLARSYLFEGLTAQALAPLLPTTRDLVRGEYTWHIGDRADELFVVLAGEVKDFVLDTEGRETVHLVHGPGMTVGEPGYFAVERNRSVANLATMPTTLIRLDRRDLTAFMRDNPTVKDRALEGLAGMIRAAGVVMASRDTRTLADRLVLRLLDLVDTSPERVAGLAVTPKISQSTLASMTGVSRENVNRALAGLIKTGAIRQDGGRYVIVDEERLRHDAARDWPLVGRRDRPSGSHDA
jgi:CRP-like cAMP-binding protein